MSSQSLINVPNRRILDKHFVAQIVGEPVKEYAISTANLKPGDNVMSNLICLDVKTVTNEIHNLVIKSVLPMTGDIDRNILSTAKFIAASGTFPREIVYYKQIRPIFQEVIKGDTKMASIFLRPKHYSSLHNKERQGLDDYLVLEDLRPHGYKMVDKFKGMAYEETVASLEQLAILHATSYSVLNNKERPSNVLQAIRQNPASMTNIHGWKKDILPNCSSEDFFNRVVSSMIDLMEEDGKLDIATKIRTITEDGHKKIIMELSNITSDQGKYFRVLIHGDLWTNNVLIKHGPDGKSVEDVKFIDFQINRFGNIYEDLQYFIFTSTTAEFRRANLRSCLLAYYQEFENVLQQLDCPLPDGFSEKELISTFHENLNYGFCYNLLAIPFQLGLPEPPSTPMTPIEVNFKANSETSNQFFASMASFASAEGSKHSVITVDDIQPDFQEMLTSTSIGLQASAKNSPIAMKRLHEIIEEMVDFGLIK